jgi:hypothetical protein
MALIKRREPATVEEEREALREQRLALEDLKQELAERVGAVRERELELQQAVKDAGRVPRASAPALATRANGAADVARTEQEHDLVEREKALASRESQLAERERALEQRSADAHAALDAREQELAARETAAVAAPAEPVEPGAERLAQIEARLEELRDAEKLFLRTRDELAARSEAVAARERLVAQKERELDEQEDVSGQWNADELSEMEARLRRLEQQTPGEQTANFAGGLRKLQQGAKRPQRPA